MNFYTRLRTRTDAQFYVQNNSLTDRRNVTDQPKDTQSQDYVNI